ncbi:MAG: hypothetical protein ACRDPV_05350, partial [Gaiellaceae bacterium]
PEWTQPTTERLSTTQRVGLETNQRAQDGISNPIGKSLELVVRIACQTQPRCLTGSWRAVGGGHDQAGRPHSRVVQA